MGEGIFKLVSISIVGLLFVSIVASAEKSMKKPSNDEATNVLLSHINLAAQVNAYNKNRTTNPPATIENPSIQNEQKSK